MKGFVNVYKPKNMSSSFAVQKVKRILSNLTGTREKVGHFGTLDPLASGVLPIAVGNATRLFDYAQDKVKVYQATFKFGIATDTLDKEGKIVKTDDKIVYIDDIILALPKFLGKISQLPPEYSAKSIDGKRAYELARAGVSVELKPKTVEIFDFKLIQDVDGKVILKDGEHTLENNEFAFEIACGSGTYIRALARDLADALGTVGFMSSLLRIQSGSFLIEDAVTIEEFEKNPLAHFKPIDYVLKQYEVFDLPVECEKQAMNGVMLEFDNLPKGDFVVKLAGEVVGIAKNQSGKLKFKTRF